jgi:hypothetical protein
MHLIGLMTLAAFKVFLSVNIGRESFIFTKILFFYPAPVTRRTDRLHGWAFLKEMSVKKTASSGIRTADMALATTAVAGSTMEFSGRIHFFVNRLGRSRSHINHFLERRETHVEAFLVVFGNVIMACSATFRGIRVGRVTYHSIMGGLPFGVLWIASMAFLTAEFAMIFVLCKRAVHIDLFVRSQRLHFSASPFPFGFRRRPGPVFVGFGNFSGDFYQLSGACMAGETVIFFFCSIRGFARGKREQKKSKNRCNGYCEPGGLNFLSSLNKFVPIVYFMKGLNLSVSLM